MKTCPKNLKITKSRNLLPPAHLSPPADLLAQGQGSWRASSRRPESASYFTFLMTTTPPTLDGITSPVVPHWQLPVGRAHCGTHRWLSGTPNGHPLTVGCLWVGPTEAPSNGWARPVAPQQGAEWRGPAMALAGGCAHPAVLRDYTVGEREPLRRMVLGKLHSYMHKNHTGILSRTIYKSNLTMNQILQCETWSHKTPRSKHRQYVLWHQS